MQVRPPIFLTMPKFCDVAVPVPVDAVFTYQLPDGVTLSRGGRILVPFGRRRMIGIVTSVHDRAPKMATKNVLESPDPLDTPALKPELLRLGQWISDYYLAPVGEVFRSMLPLNAEFKKSVLYRLTDDGHLALHLAGLGGSSTRSRKSPEEQYAEFRTLEYLAGRESVREQTLRSAIGISREVIEGLIRKKWIAREDASQSVAAARTRKIAILKSAEGKLNANQRLLIERIAGAGGRAPLQDLASLAIPKSTLSTLAKRALVEIVEEPMALDRPSLAARAMPAHQDFTAQQQEALKRIQAAADARKFSGILLHGVTGSGKTAVYLAAMKSVLDQSRSAILLVPEIGLTPAVAADVHDKFGDEVAILHSALSEKERAEHWHRIRRGEARAVVGTRSAVFAPVSDLALIIVDEEQDASYKQDEMPRYHARSVAAMRAKINDAVLILGSATPSLESYFNAKKARYRLLEMPDRVLQRPLPEVELVDMRQEFQETGGEQVVSRRLVEEIKLRLERKEQAMVLLNRRGYSPVVLCRSCGKTLECRNCAIALTHHKQKRRMECHYCGFMAPVPKLCASCGSEYVYFLGTGSEKLEELLRGYFPEARIARLDRDTVRSHADFERTLNALNGGELDLVVGTQMIAKGHDVHGVTLVGVVGADNALGLPDFRAAERTFQLLTQVAGRAGRGEIAGKVILQTFFPDHYAVQYAAQHDFVGFYEKELRFRNWMHYPPYSTIANIVLRSDKLDDTLRWSGVIGRWFDRSRHEGVRVLGPAASPIERLKRDYRYHFILKSESREKLNALLRAMLAQIAKENIPRTSVVVDVDPVWLM
jgi:primosomal protein N' (replication factor Y)